VGLSVSSLSIYVLQECLEVLCQFEGKWLHSTHHIILFTLHLIQYFCFINIYKVTLPDSRNEHQVTGLSCLITYTSLRTGSTLDLSYRCDEYSGSNYQVARKKNKNFICI